MGRVLPDSPKEIRERETASLHARDHRVEVAAPRRRRGEDWRNRAACRNADPELFFPLTWAGAAPALAMCWNCPVDSQCEAYADAIGAEGVWGGRFRNGASPAR